MKNKLFNISGRILCILLFYSVLITAQTKTNLEKFYSLTDSLAKKIITEIPDTNDQLILELHPGNDYSIFNNNIRQVFINSGKKIYQGNSMELNFPVVDIVLDTAEVEYGEVFKDGWFGTHYLIRTVKIGGNYFLTNSQKGKQEFSISSVDTIRVDEIVELENPSFSFTKAERPPEPFVSGIFEPVLAIGTAAAMVVLFFTVRSK